MTATSAHLTFAAATLAVLIGTAALAGQPAPVQRADDCFTVTVTNTPLHPAPGATVCLPINLSSKRQAPSLAP
jgi:hypothetical protein